MKTILAAALAASALTAAPAAPPTEQVIEVPGFADFLAIDGETVWATNRGRVEQWSRTGKRAEVAMTRPCGAMAVAAGSLWVADCQEKTLNRIDLKTAKKVAVIATGLGAPNGEMNVVAGAGSVWVASDPKGGIARVDPATNKVVATVPTSPEAVYLAFGEGALWAVSAPAQTIQKIDPATNAVVKTTAVGKMPGFTAAGEGGVWVQEQGDGTVARVDPATGEVSGRIKVDETLKYGDIDAGGGKVWLRTTAGQTYVVIDPKGMSVESRIGKAAGSGALRYTPAGIWTSAHDVHTLSWWSETVTAAK